MSASIGAPGPMRGTGAIYRAIWRWHFYAGLLVLPFMILLAVTGGLYLFHNEIDGIVHRHLLRVQATGETTLMPSVLAARAEAAVPGTVLSYQTAADPGAAVVVGMRRADGQPLNVYLDPYTGTVLGSLGPKDTVMGIVRRLHSLSLFGDWPPYLIEIVGGWAVILVLTGLYLWWPRAGRKVGVVSVRGTPKQRRFWRDLHAVTGLVAAAFIAFLAITGMPWSSYWGDKAQAFVTEAGIGFPAGAWGDKPVSSVPLEAVADNVGWAMQRSPVPVSGAHAGHGQHRPMNAPAMTAPLPPSIGLDQAVATFDRMGLTAGYQVALPQAADGVYSGTVYPGDLARERAIHLDRYSGRPLIDVSYADYGIGGKAIEWGVNVHMGQEFGRLNQVVLAIVCVLIVVMAVAALLMWWKRRPAGRLAAPPWPADRQVVVGVSAIILALGLIYPLTGLSIVLMLAIDLLWNRLAVRKAATA